MKLKHCYRISKNITTKTSTLSLIYKKLTAPFVANRPFKRHFKLITTNFEIIKVLMVLTMPPSIKLTEITADIHFGRKWTKTRLFSVARYTLRRSLVILCSRLVVPTKMAITVWCRAPTFLDWGLNRSFHIFCSNL